MKVWGLVGGGIGKLKRQWWNEAIDKVIPYFFRNHQKWTRMTTADPSCMFADCSYEQVPDTSPAKTSLDHFNFYINVVVDGLLCLLGYIGNIFTIVVVQRQGSRGSNAIFLQALALADSAFLTYVVLYVVLRSVYPYTGQLKAIHDVQNYLVAFVLPFGWTAQTATIWMVMLMAIDRYLMVAHPLQSTTWCTPTRARRGAGLVVLAAVLFNAVRWPRYYFTAFSSNTQTNSTFVSHLSAEIPGWHEEIYRRVYHISLTFIFLFILPLVIISVMNAQLMTAIHAARERRVAMTQGLKGSGPPSLNVTLMLVVMISIFIVCQLPDFIAAIIGAGNFKVNDTIYSYYAGIKELLLVFNSACNFYLYLIFNKKMRATFVGLFRPGSTTESTSSTQDANQVQTVVQATRMDIAKFHEKNGYKTDLKEMKHQNGYAQPNTSIITFNTRLWSSRLHNRIKPMKGGSKDGKNL